MSVEKREHPANCLHLKLSFLSEVAPTSKNWWNKFNEVLLEAQNLSDNRSIASVCCSMSKILFAHCELNPNDSSIVNVILNNKLIPIWEREIEKNDNWMHIAGNVWEFSSVVGGERGQGWLVWGFNKLHKSLPKYNEIHKYFPDEMIANGIEAVIKGRRNWYHYMLNLYKFCDIVNDTAKILDLCKQNSWLQEKQVWSRVRDYFYELLLNVNLSSVDSHLIETLYRNIKTKGDVDLLLLSEISKHIDAWKFARRCVHEQDYWSAVISRSRIVH